MVKLTNKKRLLYGVLIVSIVALIYIVLFPLGAIYRGKESIGKYSSLLPGQYTSLNKNSDTEYVLPKQYPYFGRHDYEEQEKTQSDQIPIRDDRLVSKCFFEYNSKTYYIYYSLLQINKETHGGAFEFTWQDIYSADTDKTVFSLWENPEGYFVEEHYLYYAYGKNDYGVKTFSLGGFSEGIWFTFRNVKDYQYARLDFNTFENEKISKEVYEEKYNLLSKEIYGQLPEF